MAKIPPKPSASPPASPLLLDEYFAAASDAFLPHLLAISDPKKLASFADRWNTDPRPWAREQLFAYLLQPMTSPGHNVLVKRLFKHAEKNRDLPLMAAFLHGFDCLVRRVRRTRYRWDSAARQSYEEEVLYAPKDTLTPPRPKIIQNPRTGERISIPPRPRKKPGKLFSYRTRYYLRRRAWRFFRFLAYRSPDQYTAAILPALTRYTDDDLAKGEHILDSWCLLNICFRHHPALHFTPSHVRLNESRTLNDLTPAPKCPDLWSAPAAAPALWSLLSAAQSRLVRLWAMQLLQQHHAPFLASRTPEDLLPLFDSPDDALQQFAAAALENSAALPTLPLATWFKLLDTRNPSALAAITALMQRHVTPDRLDLAQTVSLATALPAPVATLGLTFLRTRTFATATDRLTLSDLALARSAAVAPALTTFALSVLGTPAAYDVTLIIRFFDALLPPIRTAAWDWLTPPTSPGYDDPALWSRLLETPYEDVRLRLVKLLQQRAALPGTSLDQLAPLWTAVLLGIYRGGRHKIIALHQISRALVDHSDHAQKLLPILALAIRSVRPAEARVGLAAVVHAVDANPALAQPAAAALPELRFLSAGATR